MAVARSDRSQTVVVVIAAVVAFLGIGACVAVASVGAVDQRADTVPVEMLHAEPATYRPVEHASAVGQPVQEPMGGWTPQVGVQIAERALRWLNWPYAWDGGGADGPSYGRAVDRDSRNDGHVFGFDCSGLTMYALAPWRQLDHSAAAQYTEAGSFHPALNYLMPGDLIFWSKDGTVQGIGHVAVYIGGGNVVQAPHSGDVIRITPIYEVEPGAMGATRPLS
jgi:cell wall-associated NlpC family hydrolase